MSEREGLILQFCPFSLFFPFWGEGVGGGTCVPNDVFSNVFCNIFFKTCCRPIFLKFE